MTLLEIVDYVNSPGGQKIFTESVMPDVISMVSANIFRALPPQVSTHIQFSCALTNGGVVVS